MDWLGSIEQIILWLLILYVYISVFVIVSSIYHNGDLSGRKSDFWFFLGAAAGFSIFFEAGLEKALFFIPDSWGHERDGEWYTVKESLSWLISLFLSLYVLTKLKNLFKSETEK